MPFRTKVKKMFGSRTDSSSGSSLKTTTTADSSKTAPQPTPKYTRKVDPAHKATLEAFTFGDEDARRKSAQSLYSPKGSRMPSRNNSSTDPRKFFGLGGKKTQASKLVEGEDDTDTANVGGSRHHSYEGSTTTSEPTFAGEPEPNTPYVDVTQDGAAHDHTPITEADVNTAMARSTSKQSIS